MRFPWPGQSPRAVAEGQDPVDALAAALRRVLLPVFPALSGIRLTGYRVRIHTRQEGARAATRVMVDSEDVEAPSLGRWPTVGVAGTVLDAASGAPHDAITYRLLRAWVEAPGRALVSG